jgi:small subunit ribosomal protein S1
MIRETRIFMADVKRSAAQDEFAAMLGAQPKTYRNGFNPGEKVRAEVLTVGDVYVVLDVQAKREGLVDVKEFENDEGDVTVKPGEWVDSIFVGMQEGAFVFTTKLSGGALMDRTLAAAHSSGQAVEGTVQSEVNGGYEVTIGGQRAFCPFSQINLTRQEGASYTGQKLAFLVTEFDPENKNIVVSHRAVQEKEREARRESLQAEIQPGQMRKGTVSRITDFGIFVDLGGIDGLVPLKEMSWQRNVKPEDLVKPGDTVQVLVRETDWERNRVSLSLRDAQGDPWGAAAELYPVGSALRGKITHIEPFGAFVEIVPGVEGLIPIGKLGGGRRIMSPREVVSEGQEIEVQVETLDAERRRIGLKPIDERVQALKPGELAPGVEVEGIVEGIKEFGIFVRISEKQTGLLHISETDVGKGGSAIAKLERAFPPSSKIKLVVKSIEGERVSLTLPAKWRAGADDGAKEASNFFEQQKTGRRNLGSLGDAFSGLKL